LSGIHGGCLNIGAAPARVLSRFYATGIPKAVAIYYLVANGGLIMNELERFHATMKYGERDRADTRR
jgi:hypothetical protein